jgi:transcriptional regulator with XRE-family HTH domain
MARIAGLDGPDPIDLHVGRRLRARRKLMNLSQAELADALGVTFQQIQKYERGANRVSASTLYKMAVALEIPVASFYEGLPPPGAAPGRRAARADEALAVLESLAATAVGVEMAKIMISVPQATRHRLVVIAKEVAAVAGDAARDVAAAG